MGNILDQCRRLGITFDGDTRAVADLQELLWEAERERDNLEDSGEDVTVQNAVVDRLRQELNAALEKLNETLLVAPPGFGPRLTAAERSRTQRWQR